MIYLEPIGGLGNRMRTIDSTLPWCKKYGHDLTVIWNVDHYLNCPLEELFEPIVCEGVAVHVKNIHATKPFTWKGRILKLPKIGKRILGIKSQNRIYNDDLFELYASKDYLNKVALVSEVDDLFYSKVEPLMLSLVKDPAKVSWIESCYRMHPHVYHYQHFKPVQAIRERINHTTQKFHNTFGLHIRRSDHITSTAFSTTDKFVAIIESCLEKHPDATFFVCTDSPETLRELAVKYGDKIIYNEIEKYDRNDPQAIRDAVVDLYCLSETRKIYGSYFSSFSQVAADIGRIEEISVR